MDSVQVAVGFRAGDFPFPVHNCPHRLSDCSVGLVPGTSLDGDLAFSKAACSGPSGREKVDCTGVRSDRSGRGALFGLILLLAKVPFCMGTSPELGNHAPHFARSLDHQGGF